MEDPCTSFKSQLDRAKEILVELENHREEINEKLKLMEYSADLHKQLRTVNLEIKITLNEIEFAEFNIKECESMNNSIIN